MYVSASGEFDAHCFFLRTLAWVENSHLPLSTDVVVADTSL